MFTESSRYFNAPQVEAKDAQGRTVKAVVLRRLPYPGGLPKVVKGPDQLDVMAFRNYQNGTQFWHIADANPALEARELLEPQTHGNPFAPEEITSIIVPEQ